jgi:hypothetical protein
MLFRPRAERQADGRSVRLGWIEPKCTGRVGSMPLITFITTCRNRLAHLRQTLPTWLVQQDAAWVVVDYDCPERTGDWVEKNLPQVTVVRATGRPRFELARARNLGAAAVQAQWICFIDADIRLAPQFVEKIRPLLRPRHFYQASPRNIETWGTMICASDDFRRVGGYDEVLQGWGKEDDDFYARLVLDGASHASFPGELLAGISHDDGQRVESYDLKDRWLSESINHVYCRAKLDLMLLRRGPLPLAMREKLYEQVRHGVLGSRQSGQPLRISVPFLAQQTRACGPLEASLLYTLPKPQGEGQPRNYADSVIPAPSQDAVRRADKPTA